MNGRVRLSLLALMLVACSSASVEPGIDRLEGTWQWVRSTGGIAGNTITPASEGFNVQFRFSGNQVTVLRNDSVRATSTYTVRGDELTYQPSISVFTFDGGVDTQTLTPVAADSLLLSDPCCDRYSHLFVKVR